MEESGDQGFLFIITSSPEKHVSPEGSGIQEKKLIGIRFPQDRWFSFLSNTDPVFLRAPFKCDDAFIGRAESSQLIVGGGTVLISFALEEK